MAVVGVGKRWEPAPRLAAAVEEGGEEGGAEEEEGEGGKGEESLLWVGC